MYGDLSHPCTHVSDRHMLFDRKIFTTTLCILGILGILVWSACTGAQKKTSLLSNHTLKLKSLPAGVEHWPKEALALPARAPIVVTLRTGHLVHGLRDIYNWVTAEPAMLGKNGADHIRTMANLRLAARKEFGHDLLSSKDWKHLGLDPERDTFLGTYPLTTQGTAFVTQAEASMRTLLGAKKHEHLADAMVRHQRLGKALGLYSGIAQSLRQTRTPQGLRLILPIVSEARALATFDTLMQRIGWRLAWTSSKGEMQRIAYPTKSAFPVVALRVTPKRTLIIDIIEDLDTVLGEAPHNTLLLKQAITQVLDAIPSGRPFAPAPVTRPILAMSADQESLSQLFRFRGYRGALQRASRASAQRRDAEFLHELDLVCDSLKHWDVGTERLSGLVYAIESKRDTTHKNPVLAATMTLFAVRGEPLPPLRTPKVTLQVRERTLGVSMNTSVLFAKKWKRWLRVADPRKLLDIFKRKNRSAVSLATSTLSFPRNIILYLSNIDTIVGKKLNLIPVYNMRQYLTRMEAATTSNRMQKMRKQPRIISLIVLKPGLKGHDKDSFSAALRGTLIGFGKRRKHNTSTKARLDLDKKPLKPNAITSFEVPKGHALEKLTYYFARDVPEPFIVLGLGLESSVMNAEVSRIKMAKHEHALPDTTPFYLRAEPVGLIHLLTPYLLERDFLWFDPNILAQRIGPALLTIQAYNNRGNNILRFGAKLLPPPKID